MKLLPLILLVAGVVAAQSAPPRKDIPAIAKAANGAVVSIVMSDKDGHAVAQGSGFLISKDGRIATNYHVIENGRSAIVKLPDGAFFIVDGVLASDKARDVAVIKAHGENFRTLPLGNSDRLQVGEEVVAIGNPLSLESTVSNGIVSGIRTVEKEGGKLLQVTTAISPGSSGGPLFNMAGEVVGITTLYLKGGENLNFAIPINDAKRLLLAKFSKLQDLPNETEPVKAQTADGDALSGRDYYNQWHALNAAHIMPGSYVCFPDKNRPRFFVIKAYALENDFKACARKMSETPYVDCSNSSLMQLIVSPAAFKILRQGGQLMSVQTYKKGVQTDDATYFGDQELKRWETGDHFQVLGLTGHMRLVVEPKTLRYLQYFVTSNDGDRFEMDSGACEEIPF